MNVVNAEIIDRPPDTLIEKDGKFYVKPFWVTGKPNLNVPIDKIANIHIRVRTIDFFCYYYDTRSLCRHTIIENTESNTNLIRNFQNKETT